VAGRPGEPMRQLPLEPFKNRGLAVAWLAEHDLLPTEAPKPEAPKPEAPKAEQPKAEQPKAEAKSGPTGDKPRTRGRRKAAA
jgi:hypothetical protein